MSTRPHPYTLEGWLANPANWQDFDVDDPTPDKDGDITVLRYQGEGYECETCGWNDEHVDVYYSKRSDVWVVSGRTGCFGEIHEEHKDKDDALRAARVTIHHLEDIHTL